MPCKYCKNINHYIDNCPDIICRLCKKYGHPHWNCKNKEDDTDIPKLKTDIKQPTKNNGYTKNNRYTKNNVCTKNNGYTKVDDFVQYIDTPWSELC